MIPGLFTTAIIITVYYPSKLLLDHIDISRRICISRFPVMGEEKSPAIESVLHQNQDELILLQQRQIEREVINSLHFGLG